MEMAVGDTQVSFNLQQIKLKLSALPKEISPVIVEK
jgi:hypothetical protein